LLVAGQIAEFKYQLHYDGKVYTIGLVGEKYINEQENTPFSKTQ
jgi:hypothetical protein